MVPTPLLSDGSAQPGLTPEAWMAFGSFHEDDDDTDAGGHRPYNHFYDPLAGGGGLDDWPTDTQRLIGLDSFSWGSELNCHGFNFIGPLYTLGFADNIITQNIWSWQNARQYQINGLAATDPASRSVSLALAYRALGQVAHLLQDTSQPQHVRNEQHWDRKLLGTAPWLSAFEKYGKDNVASLNYTATLLDWKGAGFTKLKDFWNRGFYTWDRSTHPAPNAQPLVNNEDPTQPTNKLGLAEFSNGNFIGQRHTYSEMISPSAFFYYPLPSLTNGTDWNNLIANPAANAKTSSFSAYFGGYNSAYRFIVGKTAAQGRAVTHHGAVSYLLASAGFSTSSSIPYASCDDPDVLKDYHDILIPQAVSYSAGLMDYFFRGQLGVTPSYYNGIFTLQIANLSGSGQVFQGGSFRLFYEDMNGNRTEITASLNIPYTTNSTLANGASIQGSFPDPGAIAVQFILVYQGTIGVTGVSASDPVDAGIAIAAAKFARGPDVVEAGNSLSYGIGGVGAGENAASAVSGVNALAWSAAVNNSAPNYDYELVAPCPAVYGTDSYGSQPYFGHNYWPGGAPGGGVAGTPGANCMMWLFTQPGCVGNYPNTPGDTLDAVQYFFRFCQASWWVYLKGWLSQIKDPSGQTESYASMTYAYRGRYELDHYRTGFRATCELWARNSAGAWGWDDFPSGVAAGVPDFYIGVMPRNVKLVAPLTVWPGQYVEVPMPTGTSGSGTAANGFLGLATFDVWGIDFTTWQRATGLY
jgi:hypothetical protein